MQGIEYRTPIQLGCLPVFTSTVLIVWKVLSSPVCFVIITKYQFSEFLSEPCSITSYELRTICRTISGSTSVLRPICIIRLDNVTWFISTNIIVFTYAFSGPSSSVKSSDNSLINSMSIPTWVFFVSSSYDTFEINSIKF